MIGWTLAGGGGEVKRDAYVENLAVTEKAIWGLARVGHGGLGFLNGRGYRPQNVRIRKGVLLLSLDSSTRRVSDVFLLGGNHGASGAKFQSRIQEIRTNKQRSDWALRSSFSVNM